MICINSLRMVAIAAGAVAFSFSHAAHAGSDAKPACIQAEAVYSDSSGKFLLQFAEPGPDSAVVASLVTLTDLASEQNFEGEVIWNQGFSQPNITVTYPCHAKGTQPSGKECRYEAVLYMLLSGPEGPIGLAKLPGGEEPAASTLLLPHLARSWYYGPRNAGWSEHVPGETFALSRCRTDR